jgi:hypothetical protein
MDSVFESIEPYEEKEDDEGDNEEPPAKKLRGTAKLWQQKEEFASDSEAVVSKVSI